MSNMDIGASASTTPVFLTRTHDGDRATLIWVLERFLQGRSRINARPWKAELPRLENYASSPPRGSETSQCAGQHGRAIRRSQRRLADCSFPADHVRVAMAALIAKAECGDLYPRLREIFGGPVVANCVIGSLGRDDGGRDIDKICRQSPKPEPCRCLIRCFRTVVRPSRP